MSQYHLVRVGALGGVGRFYAIDAARYPRGAQVIVRTERGLELGEVLAGAAAEGSRVQGDGAILRGVTSEDQLLAARLVKNRDAAFESCRRLLRERRVDATLIDVEHLFDGRTLVFYFLGEPPANLEQLTSELAESYDAEVQFRAFAAAAVAGCGPDCGTDAAGNCKSCDTGCAIAGACSTRRPLA